MCVCRGDSGSGKSTLMKLLLKELEPTSGTIVVNNKILSRIWRKSESLPEKHWLCIPGFPPSERSECI
ncbi:MAG: ATP-binding cassette domain-containing protein [Eubacterium sp.]